MQNKNWESILFEDMHVFTQFARHGYIAIFFCKNRNFHFDAKADCLCEYCNELCDQCTVKKVSLREAAKIIKKY
jgi:hypothetical protein